MATTADIKIGMCIEMDGKTFQIVDFQHVKPGKGPAFVRTKLKNLESGRVLDNTFSAGAKIEPVRVERRPYQFTYEDDLGAHFMHTETFEEINIDKNLITNYDLMADGQIVEVMFHTEKETVLSAELPPIVDMEVTYTEPGIKGDTASTNSLKPATVNTDILNERKYDYLFTVEDVNRLVLAGIPFREAYKQVGMAVQHGRYRPTREVHHTHEGSIGNLCTAQIRRKMERVMSEFE